MVDTESMEEPPVRVSWLPVLLVIVAACGSSEDTALPNDWAETSFTDERGLRWIAAVSVVDDGAIVQGWAGVQNASGVPMLIDGVQNCGLRNPVELRDAQGRAVVFDPFDGNEAAVDDKRCEPGPLTLPQGETLWLSTVDWRDVEAGSYELFASYWSGQAAALRFDIEY